LIKNIFQFEAMSTPCEVLIYLDDKQKASAIAKEILIQTKELEKRYSYYNPTSTLSQINKRELQELDAKTKDILTKAKEFYKLTNHIFDITIATIKPLYSLTDLESFYEQKEKLSAYVGCEHYEIKKNKIFFDNPYTQLDLGGFVKEYAVDKAVALLKKRKVLHAMVNFGGDIYALGTKPSGEPFRVGIKNPHNPKEPITQIALQDMALTTSASYERNYTIGAKNFSHILSKQEMQQEFLSLSVVCKDTLTSGVYSTALNIDASLKPPCNVIKIDKNLKVVYENFNH
jgi:thiamine biosynthesis lipoprotein